DRATGYPPRPRHSRRPEAGSPYGSRCTPLRPSRECVCPISSLHCKLHGDSGYAEISTSEERANAKDCRMDIREQLAILRQKVEGIDARYRTPSRPPARQESAGSLIEDLVSGEVIHTAHGTHFETERHFPIHHRHGSYEISDLAALSPDLLSALSGGAIDGIPPERWLFLDTETTGLAGGSGT